MGILLLLFFAYLAGSCLGDSTWVLVECLETEQPRRWLCPAYETGQHPHKQDVQKDFFLQTCGLRCPERLLPPVWQAAALGIMLKF